MTRTRSLERKHGQLGGGSIMAYGKGGYAAYTWAINDNGVRTKKWVYGRTYENVYLRWKRLQCEARNITPPPPILDEFALSVVCDERVPMRLLGDDRLEAVRRLSAKGLDSAEIAQLLKTTRAVVLKLRSLHNIPGQDQEPWSWCTYIRGGHSKRRE